MLLLLCGGLLNCFSNWDENRSNAEDDGSCEDVGRAEEVCLFTCKNLSKP